MSVLLDLVDEVAPKVAGPQVQVETGTERTAAALQLVRALDQTESELAHSIDQVNRHIAVLNTCGAV